MFTIVSVLTVNMGLCCEDGRTRKGIRPRSSWVVLHLCANVYTLPQIGIYHTTLTNTMATPVHILLAFTRDALNRFRGVRRGATARFRPGLTEGQVLVLKTAQMRYGFETVGVEAVELGQVGLNAGRKQYQSKALLKIARDRAKALSDWHTKVLLITDADIYDVDTLFIAGQAEVNGRAAVVSLARLGAGDEERFLKRVLKESLHELGHTLGLGHCNDHDCVMFPSRVLANSDVKRHDFCKRCTTKAGRALSAVK